MVRVMAIVIHSVIIGYDLRNGPQNRRASRTRSPAERPMKSDWDSGETLQGL